MGKFLSVTVDLGPLKSFGGGPLFTPQEEQEVLDEVGTLLLSEIKSNFEELSRRGTGVDGTKWKELEVETEIRKARKGKPSKRTKGKATAPPRSQIGVDTGLLRNSAVPGHTDNVFEFGQHDVTVGFGREYAKYFHAVRPLVPDEMPKAWNEQCEAIVRDFILEKLTGRRGAG